MRTANEIEIEVMGDTLSEPYMDGLKRRTVHAVTHGDKTMLVDAHVVMALLADRDELRERDAVDRAKRERWSGTADYAPKQPRTICDQCGAPIGFKTMYFRRPGVGATHETCCYQCAQRLKQSLIDASGVSVGTITQEHLDWINKVARFPLESMPIGYMDIGDVQAALERIRVAATRTPDAEVTRDNLLSKSGAEWHAVSLDLGNHALGICASIYGECYLSLSALWDRIDAMREGRGYEDVVEIALSDAECRMIDGARNFAKYQYRDS